MSLYMHSSKFLDEFLPISSRVSRNSKPKTPDFTKIIGMTSEKSISKEWTAVVNKRRLCPGYKVALSEDRAAVGDPTKLKVDGAIYLSGQTPSNGRPLWSRLRALIEFKRGGAGNDPFDDTTGDAGAQSRTANRGQDISYSLRAFTRQQRTAIFMFLINGSKARVTCWERGGTIFTEAFDYVKNPDLLCEFLWRFSLQTDENQGIDTTAEPLKKKEHDYRLMDRLANGPLHYPKKANKANQPPDVSSVEGTTLPLPARDKDGEEAPIGTFTYIREKFAESLEDEWPRYRVTVPTSGKGKKKFLIAKPVFQAPGMVGRGTRGYIAVDVETSQFVWLKDTWRPYYAGMKAEGEILQTLKRAGVTRIPTVLCGGDLGHQTQTHFYQIDDDVVASDEEMEGQDGEQQAPTTGSGVPAESESNRGSKRGHSGDVKNVFASKKEPHSRMRHLSHYRLVVNEVCLPLDEIKSSRQLIQVTLDATEAHQQAVTKAHIIHGDISVGNVLILPTIVEEDGKRVVRWRGILADWELSKDIPEDGTKATARFPERTGTWQFTSAALLLYLGEPPRVPDEIESLFYLVLYNGVRYLLSSVAEVKWFLKEFFDSFTVVGHKYRCGSKKQDAMVHGALSFNGGEITFSSSPDDPDDPLNGMITEMLEHFKARYKILAYQHKFTLWRQSSKKHKILAPPAKMYETAQKLDTHEYFMSLLSDMLKLEDWPTEDFVGDQAASSKVAASGQSDEIPEDTTTGNDGAPDGGHAGEHDGGDARDEEESRPSKRTKEESSSEEDELDFESPSPSPLANRFPRADRGGPSRGVGLRGRVRP
ncbi:hypothetical protein C8Q74DRAFT_1362347 [Fomes fomentarius]|nr:hypothetical protein C8Q74DRAFT_1362347 [Fomes fomentarius]